MNTFGWRTRLKYGLVAGGLGWLAGWLVSFPFEFAIAWRYVDGKIHRLPLAMVEGSLIWAGFTVFMALIGFLPLILPAFLLISPGWIVRWSRWLIPAAPLAAILAVNERMGLLHPYHFRHPSAIRDFFFSGPNFFVITFALAVMWIYSALAGRRLRADRAPAAG
jgi:hypothetical protein